LHVTVRRYITDPNSVNDLLKRIKVEFVPIISKAPGFISYAVIDSGDGTIASISTFESKAGADESTRRAADWVKTVNSLLPNPPQVTAGDIVISTWPQK
jgi:quinol monooxygenase YgiN